MLRKSLIVALGFLGLFIAGTAVGVAPAAAGYTCGPWNGWCGRAFWAYPGWGYGWYGYHRRHHDRDDWRRFYSHKDRDDWRRFYSHEHWNNDGHQRRRWN
jgi:hypothetical protein